MKFKVGQIWEDGPGYQLKIVKIWPSDGNTYPVEAQEVGTSNVYYFTLDGRLREGYSSVGDLKKLISDVQPEPKKTLNFWEARQASLEGKKVRYRLEGFTNSLTPGEFDLAWWDKKQLSAEWEIVEEPKTYTTYVCVCADGLLRFHADRGALKDSDILSVIKIITDENGKLISAENF